MKPLPKIKNTMKQSKEFFDGLEQRYCAFKNGGNQQVREPFWNGRLSINQNMKSSVNNGKKNNAKQIKNVLDVSFCPQAQQIVENKNLYTFDQITSEPSQLSTMVKKICMEQFPKMLCVKINNLDASVSTCLTDSLRGYIQQLLKIFNTAVISIYSPRDNVFTDMLSIRKENRQCVNQLVSTRICNNKKTPIILNKLLDVAKQRQKLLSQTSQKKNSEEIQKQNKNYQNQQKNPQNPTKFPQNSQIFPQNFKNSHNFAQNINKQKQIQCIVIRIKGVIDAKGEESGGVCQGEQKGIRESSQNFQKQILQRQILQKQNVQRQNTETLNAQRQIIQKQILQRQQKSTKQNKSKENKMKENKQKQNKLKQKCNFHKKIENTNSNKNQKELNQLKKSFQQREIEIQLSAGGYGELGVKNLGVVERLRWFVEVYRIAECSQNDFQSLLAPFSKKVSLSEPQLLSKIKSLQKQLQQKKQQLEKEKEKIAKKQALQAELEQLALPSERPQMNTEKFATKICVALKNRARKEDRSMKSTDTN